MAAFQQLPGALSQVMAEATAGLTQAANQNQAAQAQAGILGTAAQAAQMLLLAPDKLVLVVLVVAVVATTQAQAGMLVAAVLAYGVKVQAADQQAVYKVEGVAPAGIMRLTPQVQLLERQALDLEAAAADLALIALLTAVETLVQSASYGRGTLVSFHLLM